MRSETQGVLTMAAAATLWGLNGWFYKFLSHVPPLEVLCHRILWSVVFFGLIIVLQGRMAEVRAAFGRNNRVGLLLLSSLLIAVNWFGFVYAVHVGRALEASFGYYIFPLMTVAMGYVVFGERFSRWQMLAVLLAVLAVLVMIPGLGGLPVISLVLATSFTCYGLVKKRVTTRPIPGVFIEALFLLLPSLLWLMAVHFHLSLAEGPEPGAWFGRDLATTLLLISSGPMTALPLVLMSNAAQRISFATLGLVQYLNPTMQALVAILVFGEPWTPWHTLAFCLIWSGLIIYSVESFRRQSRPA
ncbi:EamA family transporter RarD [Amaricoccus tamworthensis]|uniref:EamA family transporter RarD n=1 Tax=Amaricoccus tamworthensis TaxID=57002 RepID=UPI003C7EB3E5